MTDGSPTIASVSLATGAAIPQRPRTGSRMRVDSARIHPRLKMGTPPPKPPRGPQVPIEAVVAYLLAVVAVILAALIAGS